MAHDDTPPSTPLAPPGHIERLGERILHEPTLLLSVAYLATSALGLWADYWFYRPFGIPIFEYLQPSDLLVAGLRDPMYFLLVALGLSCSWIVNWYEHFRFDDPERLQRLRSHWWTRPFVPRWRERIKRQQNPWLRRALRIVVPSYFALLLISLYAQRSATELMHGDGQRAQLVYAEPNVGSALQPLLLGTTSDWVFVYWPERRRAEAIAQQSLQSLVYPQVPLETFAPH